MEDLILLLFIAVVLSLLGRRRNRRHGSGVYVKEPPRTPRPSITPPSMWRSR